MTSQQQSPRFRLLAGVARRCSENQKNQISAEHAKQVSHVTKQVKYRPAPFLRLAAAVVLTLASLPLTSEQELIAAQIQDTTTARTTSFEQLKSGPLAKQSDASGTWTATASDQATIHVDHQRSGKQALRLLGGQQCQVTWTLADPNVAADSLDLWFERWTRRKPFDFRVEAFVNDTWRALHHDTQNAVIGSFKNRLTLALPSPTPTQFRFTSTTPIGTGVMIDDVALTKAGPMEVVDVVLAQQIAPVLLRNEVNPVLNVQIVATGSQKPVGVSEFRVSLDSTTDLSDIEYVELFSTGENRPNWLGIEANLDSLHRFGKRQAPAQNLVFQDHVLCVPGTNHFFISVKLKPTASITNRVGVQCDAIKTDQLRDELRKPVARTPIVAQRIGFAVRKANDDNSQAYRIPGLATTKKGTLIGVYDVRYRGWGDLPNDIDVGMSRSSDGGQTWEPMRVIMDMGDDPKWRFDGVGDPSILVDQKSGTIWVTATWSHGNRSWHGSGPGLEPHETGQFMLVRSDDDGVTWSKPVNITKQIKKAEWSFILQGPGRGITMQDGTLVFPAQYQDPPDKKRTPHSTIIYSKDQGETWRCGSGAFSNTTESAVVEIEPGVLMLNCRYDLQNRRAVMITRDLGTTWEEHATSRKTLPEPKACMGSLIGPVSQNDKSFLFFSNPDAETGPRRRMSIKASGDLGMTWPNHWHMLLDEGESAGYSCLTMVDDKNVGILFEGSRSHMTYLRIPISELTNQPNDLESSSKKTYPQRLALGRVFQDHMVLQRDMPLKVFGSGKRGSTVNVSFSDDSAAAVVDNGGNWSVTLPAQWNRPTMPFLFVQLPAMARPYWPAFRDQQRRMLQAVPYTGMAIAIDTGARSNVHPELKQPVGERLASWALGTVYNSAKDKTYSGPVFRKSDIKKASIVLKFDHAGDGLVSSDGRPLRHFEVAGSDGAYHSAQAVVFGSTIEVSSAAVPEPKTARYAWLPFPEPPVNFTNRAGFPASPFSTIPTPYGALGHLNRVGQ